MSDSISRSDFLKQLAAGSLGMGALMSTPLASSGAAASNRNTPPNDFAIKGFHIDMRVEVMTLEALKTFARELAGFGINALVMEYEASFPYREHATLANRFTYTREQIREFVSYCDSLGIQVIPLQECMGHVQYILRHERYAGLKVDDSIRSQVDPLNGEAVDLFEELIRDMAALHPSDYIHIGGDEVRHLHHEKYKDYLQAHGVSKLYTQYMKKMCQIVIDLGKTPVLWADMILQHPEAVEDLPVEQMILVDWNYGWDTNMFGNIQALQQKGCTFWGAPALRSSPDNYYLTRWEKHFNNLRDFIPYSRRAGYEGMVMTSWSTSGIYRYWVEGNQKAVLEMFPIRNLYPLSGFRILVAAYAQSLQQQEPIDPKQFVRQYARERFGLSESDTQTLWKYVSHQQVLITTEDLRDPTKVASIRDAFTSVNQSLHALNPVRHQHEFEHFRLMGDIRAFYLSVKQIDAQVETPGFGRDQMKNIAPQLKPLHQTADQLDVAFKGMNRGYLHEAELERLNRLRNKRLENLSAIYG